MGKLRRYNWFGGGLAWLWLIVIMIPIWFMLVSTFKSQPDYFAGNPLAPPASPTLDNFAQAFDYGFWRYFMNSSIVTIGAVVPMVLFSFMASYAIVRGKSKPIESTRKLFLLGLAIPVQATIVPLYLLVIQMGIYDTLIALILPGIAFGLPLTILILSNFLRDVPKELFESMSVDGCSEWQMMWRLAFPMTQPALVTVTVYQALLQWNSFLFPLILLQSTDNRTLPLFLWNFQGEFATNIPVVLTAVFLSSLPILLLYIVGRRQLVAGMTMGAGK